MQREGRLPARGDGDTGVGGVFVFKTSAPVASGRGPIMEINRPATRRNVISSHDSSPPPLLPVLRLPRHPFHGTQECLCKVPIRSHPKRAKDLTRKPDRSTQGRRVTCRLQLGWLPPSQAQRFLQGW